MLDRIQEMLADLYDLPVDRPVGAFLCDAEVVEQSVEGAVARGEVLLVAEEPDGLAVGLYVCPDAVARLTAARAPAPSGSDGAGTWSAGDAFLADDAADFAAACLATEGVSHFVYLTFRADNDDSVTQLELELQAEVDKYATGLLAGQGMGAIRARSRALRERLFEGVRFIDAADTEVGERYRTAHRWAARYAASLEARHLDGEGDLDALGRELRRFYRMGMRGKLEAATR